MNVNPQSEVQRVFNPKIGIIKAGDKVRHATFGEGLVTKCESAPGDVIVTITFDSNNEIKRFLLSSTPMEKTGEYIAPPEKIQEPTKKIEGHTEKIPGPKSSHTYTTEFKIKVVEQALSEGRAVVRKHYKLPETTLRSWIKALS